MNFKHPIILASGSPRRQQLLRDMGFEFIIKTKHTDEDFPENLKAEAVPEFLANKKISGFVEEAKNSVVITSDTVVIQDHKILGKPADYTEAFEMIQMMSGKCHEVITGVCIMYKDRIHTFSDITTVTFREITKEETDYYITHFSPYDKAGSYGIQEWIGMVAIEKIDGSYFNVVGLPTEKLYQALLSFNK